MHYGEMEDLWNIALEQKPSAVDGQEKNNNTMSRKMNIEKDKRCVERIWVFFPYVFFCLEQEKIEQETHCVTIKTPAQHTTIIFFNLSFFSSSFFY